MKWGVCIRWFLSPMVMIANIMCILPESGLHQSRQFWVTRSYFTRMAFFSWGKSPKVYVWLCSVGALCCCVQDITGNYSERHWSSSVLLPFHLQFNPSLWCLFVTEWSLHFFSLWVRSELGLERRREKSVWGGWTYTKACESGCWNL